MTTGVSRQDSPPPVAARRAGAHNPVQSYRSRRSRALHAVLVAGGWVAFALLWWRVLSRPGALADVRNVAMIVGVLAVAAALVTWAWIAHNIALARRRGGRHTVVPLGRPTADLLGRRLEVPLEATTASYVVVRVSGPVKQFVTGDRAGV